MAVGRLSAGRLADPAADRGPQLLGRLRDGAVIDDDHVSHDGCRDLAGRAGNGSPSEGRERAAMRAASTSGEAVISTTVTLR